MDRLFSPVGLGTAGYELLDKDHAISLLHHGIESGLTHIDTAEMYGFGAAEDIVGQATHDRRDKVFLGTKVWPVNASKDHVIKACENSLRRLKTDYIDLYTLHWPSPYPVAETMEAMIALQDVGKIRAIGVSNFTHSNLQQLSKSGYACYVQTNQIMYNLNERLAEAHVFPTCRDMAIRMVGYSPLSGGKDFAQSQVLQKIAETHDKTVHQVALNFLSNNGDIALIPKTTKHEQVRSLAGSLDFTLTTDERAALAASYPITGPQDGLALPVDKNHYFRGDYQNELQSLFVRLGFNQGVAIR